MILKEDEIINSSIGHEVWEKLPIVKKIIILKKLGEITDLVRSEFSSHV